MQGTCGYRPIARSEHRLAGVARTRISRVAAAAICEATKGRCPGCQGAWPALTSLCRGASWGGQYGMLWCALWFPSVRCGTVAWACAVTPCGQPPPVCVAPAGAAGPMTATAPRPMAARTFRIRLSVRLARRGVNYHARSYPRRAHTYHLFFTPACRLKAGRMSPPAGVVAVSRSRLSPRAWRDGSSSDQGRIEARDAEVPATRRRVCVFMVGSPQVLHGTEAARGRRGAVTSTSRTS